eukprot:scaffold703_cov168-Amphora_coffeaeformis.AAC.5
MSAIYQRGEEDPGVRFCTAILCRHGRNVDVSYYRVIVICCNLPYERQSRRISLSLYTHDCADDMEKSLLWKDVTR